LTPAVYHGRTYLEMTTYASIASHATHPEHPWIVDMFDAVDQRDVDAFVEFMAPDGRFRFGNGPMLEGREAVAGALEQFFGSIAGLSHHLLGVWQDGHVVTVEADVTYTTADARDITVPVVSLLRLSGPRSVEDYRIFVDLGPLFAPAS
jgi:ketosteroid isomerase-like protein